MTKLRGHSGDGVAMKGPGVKGVAPDLPPAKGRGTGRGFDSSPGSFRGRGINELAGGERGFSWLPPVPPVASNHRSSPPTVLSLEGSFN